MFEKGFEALAMLHLDSPSMKLGQNLHLEVVQPWVSQSEDNANERLSITLRGDEIAPASNRTQSGRWTGSLVIVWLSKIIMLAVMVYAIRKRTPNP